MGFFLSGDTAVAFVTSVLLADVVFVADAACGAVCCIPVEEYRHWSDAVPAETLAAAAAKHDGRVLRVILRTHPPVMRSFGPRSLGLLCH